MKAYLREATEKDIDILYEWVNDPVVRGASFSEENISYSEHQKWYKKVLNSANCRQYIYIYDNTAVGQVRIWVSDNEAEISYSVCKEKRCMGHGKLLLQLTYEQVKDDFPNVQKLVAKVKPGNVASQHAFLAVGYTEKYSFFELDISDTNMVM